MKKTKVAIFDIDGTIFRSSLLIRLIEALIEEGVFSSRVVKTYTKEYENWLNRKGTYEDYIYAIVRAFEKNIRGVDYNVLKRVTDKVATINKDRVYCFTRDLVIELKKKNYYLLAISHSPKEIVQRFARKMGFDKMYGRTYEVDENNKITGKTLYLDLISNKANVLKRFLEKEKLTLKGSVGVGDSDGDITFLSLVDRPICFNPNAKLYAKAKREGWQVVVERKDVIYNI